MSKIDGLLESLNDIGNRPDNIKRRAKMIINIFILFLFPLVMLMSNAEVFIIAGIVIPSYFSLQHLFVGEMSFVERWIKMFKVFMMYAFIIMIAIVIIENFFPSIAPIIYYTIK